MDNEVDNIVTFEGKPYFIRERDNDIFNAVEVVIWRISTRPRYVRSSYTWYIFGCKKP